jgi:membrane fusion protein, copper/silver efflux system
VCRTCNCGMMMKKWRVERLLAIPETAVVDTGERKVVYVESMAGVYDAYAVTLGSRIGMYYPVLDGLKLGQKIVTRGAFLIDAEARLNPAMAHTAPGPEKTSAEPMAAGHKHGE